MWGASFKSSAFIWRSDQSLQMCLTETRVDVIYRRTEERSRPLWYDDAVFSLSWHRTHSSSFFFRWGDDETTSRTKTWRMCSDLMRKYLTTEISEKTCVCCETKFVSLRKFWLDSALDISWLLDKCYSSHDVPQLNYSFTCSERPQKAQEDTVVLVSKYHHR